MKTNIDLKWYDDTQVVCACGNSFTTGSTRQTIKVEICHKCHPFFTGEMKYVDTLGRVEKFQNKQKTAASYATVLAVKKQKKKAEKQEEKRPKTLREMLLGSS